MLHAILIVMAGALADTPTTTVDNFQLPSLDGATVALQQPGVSAPFTVIATLRADDAASRKHAEKLQELFETYAEEGFRFLALMADDSATATDFAGRHEVTLPVLLDRYGYVAGRLGVPVAPAVVVVDDQLNVLFRGQLDDQFAKGSGGKLSHDYVVDALEALLMEEDVEVRESPLPETPLFLASADNAPTFYGDVAPILYDNCTQCHRPGQIGPMPFVSFDDAQGWAPMIAEVVDEGRMPPWHADPRHGAFSNARVLTDHQKATLVRWAETGAREGKPDDSVQPPSFVDDEWQIGKPDVIYQLPEVQKIPAEGMINYRYFSMDPGFDEDRWVEAIEVRPTAIEATHHVICFMVPAGVDQGRWLNSPEALGDGMLGGYAPGAPPEVYEPGIAKLIPAGTRFLFEVHYTAVGQPMEDQTRMGIRFARGEVKQRHRSVGVVNPRLNIQPGDPAAEFSARFPVRDNMLLVGLTPHMHARGKSFRFELLGADEDEILLDVPAYDFNWQHTYNLEQPRVLEAGSNVFLTAVYDNSEGNPFNPDPSSVVRWGQQTWEEMMIGWLLYLEDLPPSEQR